MKSLLVAMTKNLVEGQELLLSYSNTTLFWLLDRSSITHYSTVAHNTAIEDKDTGRARTFGLLRFSDESDIKIIRLSVLMLCSDKLITMSA